MEKNLKPVLDAGFIDECAHAVISHEIVVAAKRDADGGWSDVRVCVNYSDAVGGVNKYTPKDPYRLPLPDQIYDDVKDHCKYLSVIDAKSGFFQIPIPEHLQHLTAFWWDRPGIGPRLYKWKRLPFGLTGAPAFFQRVMERCIRDAGLEKWVKVFVDDVLIATNELDGPEGHYEILKRVFEMFRANGLKFHPTKSRLCCSQVEFLGHQLSENGKTPSESKVAAIRALPVPDSVSTLRRLIGFCSYYREYTPHFTKYAYSLYELLQKGAVWDWTSDRDSDWAALKEELCKEGNALRRADPDKPYILHTDWSKHGLSAVLNQAGPDGKEYMVACASRSCNKAESTYGSYKGELLAVCFAVKTFKYYLLGARHPTVLFTDHKGLVWLQQNQDLSGQYQRWQVILSAYDLVIKYKQGITHEVADVPSRFPCPTTEDTTGCREPDSTTTRKPRVDVSHLQGAELQQAIMEVIDMDAVPVFLKGLSLAATPYAFSNSIIPGVEGILSQPPTYADGDDIHAEPLSHIIDDLHACLGHEFNEEWQAIQTLTSKAESIVATAQPALDHVSLQGQTTLQFQHPMAQGELYRVTSLHSAPLPLPQIQEAQTTGVTVLELFGGLAGGLEMILRNGWTVQKYIYCDKDPQSRAIASHRLKALSISYADQFPISAWDKAFDSIPQDVWHIRVQHLQNAGCMNGSQWFVIGGFECQDLSPASGHGKGLAGSRSSSFFPLIDIIGTLQLLQATKPPLYLIENTSMQVFPNTTNAIKDSYTFICNAIGDHTLLDAATAGSAAHRLRNYWTNLCHPAMLDTALQACNRLSYPHTCLADILGPRRKPMICSRVNCHPWCAQANNIGSPIQVLPTLMATQNSRAFLPGAPGMVWAEHPITGAWGLSPLTMDERELAVGYSANATNAPGVSYDARHKATGSCFDANAVSLLMAVALAIRKRASRSSPYAVQQVHAHMCHGLGGDTDRHDSQTDPDAFSFDDSHIFLTHAAMSVTQAQEEAEHSCRDIWDDINTMSYLREDTLPDTDGEVLRVRKRAKSYKWDSHRRKLFRVMKDGTPKEVPHPENRLPLIRRIHESNGHWGRRRTAHMLMMNFWFVNMFRDVRAVVQSCTSCSQTKATFNSMQPHLQSLPIKGLNYRWSLDLAGPFETSANGHTYVLIAIESFSKWVEYFPLKKKSAQEVAYHVLHGIISRFGACAEIVTDGGGEFQGELEQLLVKCLIDHRVTSSSHPQANGLAERCVKSFKACLSRCVHSTGEKANWDLYLPWIALGYRVSPQEATKLSPYHIMFATAPIIPPNIVDRMQGSISFDDPDVAAESILLRAKAIEDACAIAGQNLLIAQHRDSLRYAKLRSGGYLPKLSHFFPGQYVYVRDQAESIHNMARPEILRVKEVRSSGVLILEGADNATIAENIINCAPCHLPILAVDPSTLPIRPHINLACQICGLPDHHAVLLICDSCYRGWHTYCIAPYFTVPSGTFWFCKQCTDAGVDPSTGLTQRAAADVPIPPAHRHTLALPASTTQRHRPSPVFHTRPGQKMASLKAKLLK
jgi:hypothetical protein